MSFRRISDSGISQPARPRAWGKRRCAAAVHPGDQNGCLLSTIRHGAPGPKPTMRVPCPCGQERHDGEETGSFADLASSLMTMEVLRGSRHRGRFAKFLEHDAAVVQPIDNIRRLPHGRLVGDRRAP